MGFFRNARELRAALLACGMVWLGPVDISVAGPAGHSFSASSVRTSPSGCTRHRFTGLQRGSA